MIELERKVVLAAYLAIGLAIVNICILMMLGMMVLKGATTL